MVYWELGRKVFEKYLVDVDFAVTNYQWHYLYCGALFENPPSSIDPVEFLKRCDPSGSYVRRYVPVLEGLPDEFVYEPWRAPLNVQEEAGCVVGKDYPQPMIDHDKVSQGNMECIKKIRSEFLKFN